MEQALSELIKEVIKSIRRPVTAWCQARMQRRAMLTALAALSNQESRLLDYCVSRKRKAVLLPMMRTEAKVAAGLCQKHIMEKATGENDYYAWPHTIPDIAWKEHRKRPKSTSNDPSDEENWAYLDKLTSGDARILAELFESGPLETSYEKLLSRRACRGFRASVP